SLQKVAEEHGALVLRELLKSGIFSLFRSAYVRMQAAHNLGRVRVKLGAFAEAIQARIPKFVRSAGERGGMHPKVIRKHIVKGFLPRIIGGVFEKLCAKILVETDDLEQMAVPVTRECGNSHSGKDFPETRIDGR